ncbi:glycosyltransferase family protein [Pontibacter sp. JH31]|uniref:Glycosyltransferase family protein n=1 Tax=Pontibacter aquaedesilientis TaxID=2766980 RepID=A0ABR7XH91_9BACT|nr:glycosyltransferase family protein [Pontibacter aquaedesilientis]MBD1397640.1 glycosyltransferase family protein [Pontibacter aquaedesilientis]
MTTKKVGVISQARMTSTRLPGKVLLKAGGKTMLQHHVDRLRDAGLDVYIATTQNTSDDPIAAYAAQANIPCYRGDEHNVLSRFYECALRYGLDVIVRVTSDCPLIDGQLIADAVQQYLAWDDEAVYLSNALQRTFPRGFDFEIFSFGLLKEAFQNATLTADLEHVTPYINQNKSGRVTLRHYTQDKDASQFRITLDTPEDFELISLLMEQHGAHKLSGDEIMLLLENHPKLQNINAHVEQKKLGE